MENLTVIQRPKITAHFTPEQWELFEEEYALAVSQILNQELRRCVNSEIYDKKATRRVMLSAMQMHAEVGAYDTEPRLFLERVLDEIFGEA